MPWSLKLEQRFWRYPKCVLLFRYYLTLEKGTSFHLKNIESLSLKDAYTSLVKENNHLYCISFIFVQKLPKCDIVKFLLEIHPENFSECCWKTTNKNELSSENLKWINNIIIIIIFYSWQKYNCYTLIYNRWMHFWVINCIIVFVALEDISFKRKSYHCKIRPLFCTHVHGFKQTGPAATCKTRDVGFRGLIISPAPFSHLLLQLIEMDYTGVGLVMFYCICITLLNIRLHLLDLLYSF